MPTLFHAALGAMSVLIGLAWVVWPVRSMRVQSLILYLGRDSADWDPSTTEVRAGRIGGGVLVVLGIGLLAGVLPP